MNTRFSMHTISALMRALGLPGDGELSRVEGDRRTLFEGNLNPEPLDYRVGPQQGMTRLNADHTILPAHDGPADRH